MDGLLTDSVWQKATVLTDFVVRQPNFGSTPSAATTVKVFYTNEAIYVGAYLYDDPKNIRKQMTLRDREQRQDVDWFMVSIDTYKDRQNAFSFVTTSVNVQSDIRVSSNASDDDDNDGNDYNWDAVWDSHVAMHTDGWSVEVKIPYMSIRFAKTPVQDWGINFSRFLRRLNETSTWNPINPSVAGFVNQFGAMQGIQDIEPPLRLSFQPYISGGYQTIPTNNGTRNNVLRSGGMDVKYGVNESFTLDMTLIPDFGQVVSDNVILNLTPFEQQFQENRPFFTEGTELFNKAGLFYSRRIGGTPINYFDARQLAADSGHTIVNNPSVTQLYNATKFSGRTKGNLGIGVFNAITAPMYATLRDGKGNEYKYETSPLTNYNVLVLDQAFKNRSFVTLTNTNTWRNGKALDANVTGLDVSLFDKTNTYNLRAKGVYSYRSGEKSGYKSTINFDKVSGRWQYGIANNIESQHYNPNDLGILFAPNEFSTSAYVSYFQFVANEKFNYRQYNLSVTHQNLYAPFKFQEFKVETNFFHWFKSMWDANIVLETNPIWFYDYFELRTDGRVLKRAPWAYFGVEGSSDSRKKLFFGYAAGFAESPLKNDPYFNGRISLRYRFSNKFSLDASMRKELDKGNFGWALFDPATGEPILGRRVVKTSNLVINGVYNFQARMNLTVRARHYWSFVDYTNFYDVNMDGSWTDRAFIPNRNRSFNAWNVDMFFTWDFMLGSRLIVAYKNALGPDVVTDATRYTKYHQNLWQTLRAPQSHEFTVRFIYFLDYNTLVRKKKQA